MNPLFLALCIVIGLSSPAVADMSDYYKYVEQYQKDRDAFLELKERAENGDVAAQSELGTIYFEGRPPGLPQNIKKAHTWWKKAADSGDMEAQYRMGFFASPGIGEMIGVEGDEKEAFKYLEQAAESGHREAQKMMMGILAEGNFLTDERDFIAAYKWAGLAVGEGENTDEDVAEAMKKLENMMTEAELNRAKGILRREISKRDAHKGGMGAYGRSGQ
jgi:TPR repeat protein